VASSSRRFKCCLCRAARLYDRNFLAHVTAHAAAAEDQGDLAPVGRRKKKRKAEDGEQKLSWKERMKQTSE
jgi:hypothetical protein